MALYLYRYRCAGNRRQTDASGRRRLPDQRSSVRQVPCIPQGLLPLLQVLYTAMVEHQADDVRMLGGTTQLAVEKIIKEIGTDIMLAAGGRGTRSSNGSEEGAKNPCVRQSMPQCRESLFWNTQRITENWQECWHSSILTL